jgi:hypothetical protein
VKFTDLKQTVRTKILDNFTGASLNLGRLTSLEMAFQRMRRVIGLQIPHSILNSWRNILRQFLKVHGVNNVRQPEINTAKPLMSEPSAFDVKMSVEKLRRYK